MREKEKKGVHRRARRKRRENDREFFYSVLVTDQYLDLFATNEQYYGYMILHNKTIPQKTIGDDVGLFPITYLNRVMYNWRKPHYKNTTDMAVRPMFFSCLKVRSIRFCWAFEPNGSQ